MFNLKLPFVKSENEVVFSTESFQEEIDRKNLEDEERFEAYDYYDTYSGYDDSWEYLNKGDV